jgi:hypothetical protein
MSQRRLIVTADLLIEIAKHGLPRPIVVISNPLPANTTVVRIEPLDARGDVYVVLESDAWVGESDEPLSPPIFQEVTR